MNISLQKRCVNLFRMNKLIEISIRGKKYEPKRKPLWMAVAPSKLYRVHEPPDYPKDEYDLMMGLTFEYFRKSKSIHTYFKERYYLPTTISGGFTESEVQK